MTSTESTTLDEVCRHWSINVSLDFPASRQGRGISGTLGFKRISEENSGGNAPWRVTTGYSLVSLRDSKI